MNKPSPSIVENLPVHPDGQITPFHIRAQLRTLLFGPGTWQQRIFRLFTQSWSPWHFRERFVDSLRETLVTVRPLSKEEVIEALEHADKKALHIGLIADGNRRFERLMGKGLGWGHAQGARQIRDTFLPLVSQIPQITECSLYLLSDSNLKNRPEEELEKLDALFQAECADLLELARSHQLSYRHAGDLEALKQKMPRMADGLLHLVNETSSNTGMRVNLCINYQAKTELGEAAKKWAKQSLEAGLSVDELMALDNAQVTEQIRQSTWIPQPMDLCIRTGGDNRISGFPPNQPWNENCEFAVLGKFLPQMTDQDTLRILMNFAQAEQRMGK